MVLSGGFIHKKDASEGVLPKLHVWLKERLKSGPEDLSVSITAPSDVEISPRVCGGTGGGKGGARKRPPPAPTQRQLLRHGTILGEIREFPLDPLEFSRGGSSWGRQAHWELGVELGGNWRRKDDSRSAAGFGLQQNTDQARRYMKTVTETWPWWWKSLPGDWRNWVPRLLKGNGYTGVMWRLQRAKWEAWEAENPALASAGDYMSVEAYDNIYKDLHTPASFDWAMDWSEPFYRAAVERGVTIEMLWDDWHAPAHKWDGVYVKYFVLLFAIMLW